MREALVTAGWARGGEDTGAGGHRATLAVAQDLGRRFGVELTPPAVRASGTASVLAASLARQASARPGPASSAPTPRGTAATSPRS
ncbi:hypothetical protein HFP72_29375 [Nocardiopsis sp. ARC36]